MRVLMALKTNFAVENLSFAVALLSAHYSKVCVDHYPLFANNYLCLDPLSCSVIRLSAGFARAALTA